MSKIISQRQREVLGYLQSFINENGHSPSTWDIANHFGFSSPATVHKYLVALESAGHIARGKRNSLVQLVQAEQTFTAIEIPFMGSIAAGRPIEAVRNEESIAVPPDLIGRRSTYALRVSGDSMIEDHICDGDTLIVEARETAENGQTVVALVGETMGESGATVKRFYRERGRIRLQPANSSFQPIVLPEDQVRIQGVVIAIMRRFS